MPIASKASNRGLAYRAKGEHDRAIQDYDEAIKLNPNLAIAFYNRGLAYGAKGQHDRAIQDFDQAIRLNPSDAKSEVDALRQRLGECWKPPVGAREVPDLKVVFRVLFNPDGLSLLNRRWLPLRPRHTVRRWRKPPSKRS
jgi:tetratricopeptide (TPR) repeat protein